MLSFFLYLASQLCETFMNVGSCLWANFIKLHIVFFSKHISFLICHLSLIAKIRFGSKKNFTDILRRIGFDLFDPICDIVIRAGISYRICKNDSCCSFIIGLSDVSESFLSGCIPDLHFDTLIINIQHFYFEVHSDGGNIVLLEDSFAEISKHIGLSNSTVSNYDDFEKHIWSYIFLWVRHLLNNSDTLFIIGMLLSIE